MTFLIFSSIRTRFDERKAAAAAAVLLGEAGGKMEYLRLLKLLYMADRESWDKLGRPITGDDYVSMDHGPVLSRTYNLIKAEGETSDDEVRPWQGTVERVSRHDVQVRGEPDLGPLSEAEIGILRDTFHRFRKMPLWPLVKHLHEILPEWTNPVGSSIEIMPETILKALGKSEAEIEEVSRESKERAHFERLLGVR